MPGETHQSDGESAADLKPRIQTARNIGIFMICLLPFILGIVNMAILDKKNDKWQKAYQFSVHAYAEDMHTNLQFAGPFMSKVYMTQSGETKLKDNSIATHQNCRSALFNDTKHFEKCRMMRSGPMKLGKVAHSWSVLGEQSTFTLVKNVCIIFFVFSIFWVSEYMLHGRIITHPHHKIRSIVLLVVLGFIVADVVSNITTKSAVGSMSTAFSFVVLCFLIICCEYAGINGKNELHMEPKLFAPKNEHMQRNIYMSYAFLLILPQIVVFILSYTHDAIVDVHIQLIFLSFIFYATLDVFQTRCIAVLLCLQDEGLEDESKSITATTPRATPDTESVESGTTQNNGEEKVKQTKMYADLKYDLRLVKYFVVLAFSLCKFFVLIPSLVLLQTQYTERDWQKATVGVHYLLLAFPVLDLVHIMYDAFKPMHDLFKGLLMLVYVCFILGASITVDS